MTEQNEPRYLSSDPLTSKPNFPRLGKEGDIFMADETSTTYTLTAEEIAEYEALKAAAEAQSKGRKQGQETVSVEEAKKYSEAQARAASEAAVRSAYHQFGAEAPDGYLDLPEGMIGAHGYNRDEETAAERITSRLYDIGEGEKTVFTLPGRPGEAMRDVAVASVRQDFKEKRLKTIVENRIINSEKKPAQIFQALLEVLEKYTERDNEGNEINPRNITTEDLLIQSFQKDMGWESIITMLLGKIESGELLKPPDLKTGVNEAEKKAYEAKRDNFVKVLKEAQELILGIWSKKKLGGRSLEEVKQMFKNLAYGVEGDREFSIKDLLLQHEHLKIEIIPKCIEDLGKLIMDSAEEEYRTGNKFQILNENGEFQSHNFLAWCRDRAYFFHDQFSDSDIDLFSNISVNTMYRTISLGEMINIDKYFMTRDLKFNPKINQMEETYKHSEVFKNLRDLALYEMWLFSQSHNFDVKYRSVMGSETELQKAQQEIYSYNVFTKNKMRFLKVLMLPGNNAEEMAKVINCRDKFGNLMKVDEQREQGSVGKAIRRAILAYYYLSEVDWGPKSKGWIDSGKEGQVNMFEKVLGDAGVLKFYKYIIGKVGGAGELEKVAKNQDKEVVKGVAEKILWDHRRLKLTDLNVFNGPKTEEFIKEDLVRDGLKRAIGNNAYLYADLKNNNPELYKELCKNDMGLDKKEAKYAAEWATTMAYWTGIGARNDCTSVIGHDAWSKMMNMKDYRLGQQQGKSAIGDFLTMFGWRKLSVDFFQGTNVAMLDRPEFAHDFNSKTFLEVLQGGKGSEVNLDRFERFEFKGNASRKFVDDHLMNAWQVWKWVSEGQGINFAKMMNLDDAGYPVVNQEEVNKLFKGLWKNLRYAYDMQDFAYGNEVRTWWKDKNGKLIFGQRKIEQTMFDDEILSLKMYNDRVKKGKRQADDSRELHKMGFVEKKDEEGRPTGEFDFDKRRRIARNLFAWLLSKEIEKHVYRVGGSPKYTSQAIEKITDFFTHYPFGMVEEDSKHEVFAKNYFFNKQEFKDILKLGHSSFGKTFAIEALTESATGSLEAVWIFFKEFFKAIFK